MPTVNTYHYETLDPWKILETAEEKNQVTHARLSIRMSFDFSIAIVDHVLKFLKEIYFQSRILHPVELSVKATGVYTLPKQENKPRSMGGKPKGKRDPEIENKIQPRKEAKEIPRMVVEQSPRTIAMQVCRVSSPD